MIHSTAAVASSNSAWDIPAAFDMKLGIRKSITAALACSAWLLVATTVATASAATLTTGASTASNPALVSVSHAGWPLFFEAGPASPDSPTNFLARGPNYELCITPAEVDFALRRPRAALAPATVRREKSITACSASASFMRMSFTSANPLARISGTGEMQGRVNYFIGNDPAAWRTQVPIFAQVKIESLYPGIDLVYYGNHQQIEYDFTVGPRADARAIRMRFAGVDKLSISSAGELVLALGDDELRQHKPLIYQLVRGVRREVSGGYELKDSRTVAFTLGNYDHDSPLVIDPIFSYSTYFGGNAGDTGLAIKVDATGAAYLAGETLSTQFPAGSAGNPFQSQMRGGVNTGDAFIAKLDNTGSRLLYFTYLGGTSDDGAYDLAIDNSGNAFVAGFTVSPDFPTRNALFPQIGGAPDPKFHLYPGDAFVAELNTNGSALIFSTYLGGSDKDLASAIAVDPAGNVYVTGNTYSTNFPVLNPIQGFLAGVDDVFVAKLSPGGRSLIYSTYLGGISIDESEGIAADSAGYAYVSGYTASTNFPITLNAAQTNLNGSGASVAVFDAFVAKIATNGQSLLYSTFLGGSQNDYGYRIALDSSGNAYVTGATESPDFAHSDSFGLSIGEDGTNAINFDAFLTKLDTGGKPVYSAQFGGIANDAGWDVAVDSSGRAFVIGITLSTNFPVVHPFDLFRSTNSGSQDIFVVAFDTNAAPVLYSAYLGGSANDFGYAIAIDAEANAYLSGMTLSTNFPVARAFDTALAGTSDSFVAKIRLMNPLLNVQQLGNSFDLTWPATAPDYVLQSTTDLSLPQVWTTVSQVPVLTNGQYLVSLTTTNSSTLFRLFRP
jgi:hypothetical protein